LKKKVSCFLFINLIASSNICGILGLLFGSCYCVMFLSIAAGKFANFFLFNLLILVNLRCVFCCMLLLPKQMFLCHSLGMNNGMFEGPITTIVVLFHTSYFAAY
jgi:hypothetical protein